MKLFTRNFLLASLLLPLLLAGCIKEDFSDCLTGLKVYFTHEPGTLIRTSIDHSEVDRLDLFVFDDAGIFRGIWTDENPKLSSDYYMTIPNLPEGNYTFVAWDGDHPPYSISTTFIVGQTTINEAIFSLEHQMGEVENDMLQLFHASKQEYVYNTRDQKVYVPLVQLHNTINLTTEGLPLDGNTYQMTISDNNGKYYFDNSFAPSGDFTYKTSCAKDAQGQLSATLNILKLAADRSPIFKIYNVTQGSVLFEANLITLLNRIGNIDYDTQHTFDIHIKFTTDMKAIIAINGWQVTEDSVIVN